MQWHVSKQIEHESEITKSIAKCNKTGIKVNFPIAVFCK